MWVWILHKCPRRTFVKQNLIMQLLEFLGSILPVKVHLVTRGDYDPIFSDTPYPLWAIVPPWIRPDTVIYTVHAIDADKATVQYKLESGGFFSISFSILSPYTKMKTNEMRCDVMGGFLIKYIFKSFLRVHSVWTTN